MEKYEIKLENGANLRILDDNLICLYGNEHSSNYFIKIDNLLREISKKKYNDEWFIEKAIYTETAQRGKTYTFYRNDNFENEIEKYNWCQRPCDTNMSLEKFNKNGTISCYMSESLAEHHGLVQIDLNEFIHKFVKSLIKENIYLREIIQATEKRNSSGYNKILNKFKEEAKKAGIYDNPDLLEKGAEE